MPDHENPVPPAPCSRPYTVHIAGDVIQIQNLGGWTFTQRCSICRKVLMEKHHVKEAEAVNHWLPGYFIAMDDDDGTMKPTDIDDRITYPCFAPRTQAR